MKSHFPFAKKTQIIDEEFLRSKKILVRLLDNVVEKPHFCAWGVAEAAFDCFVCKSFSTPGNCAEPSEYLLLAKDMMVLHFELVINEGKEVRFSLDGEEYVVIGNNRGERITLPYWLFTFSISVLARDVDARKKLCTFGEEHFSLSKIAWSDFDISILNMFEGLFDKDADIAFLIKDVMNKSDPKLIVAEEQGYAYDILLPLANLYTLVVSKDEEGRYQKAFLKALESHQRYWIQKKHDAWGHYSILLAAVASLALDHKGYKLPLESEYAPSWLVSGNWE